MACADVTSANVVGYQGVQLNAGGKDMISGTFLKVGGTEEIALSKLKITGYENSDMYKYAYGGFTLTFQIRKTDGTPENTYMYYDGVDIETFEWIGGVWTDADSGAEINADNEVNFPVGKGFWLDCPDLEDCDAFYLQAAGQVIKGDYAFELNAGGKIGACNVMPVDTKLSKIEVHGYEDSEMYVYAYGGFTLTMQKLQTDGLPAATYMYYDGINIETFQWLGGVWSDADSGATITEDNDVDYEAGKGFWVDCPDLEDCDSFNFVFPKCLD